MTALQRIKFFVGIVAAGAAGWLAHGYGTVHAAESGSAPAFFQLEGTGPGAQLSIYDSNTRTISIYQGVGSGADTKFCSYQFFLGRVGGPIRRKTCDIGTLP